MEQEIRNRAITLDPRLQKCAEYVRPGKRVADIGTDHGYIPIALLQSGKTPFAVASDINEGPLESAKRSAARYGFEDKMKFVLSDGLHGVESGDADDIVIAGMGGELILRIVTEAPWLCSADKHLVLQPMTTAAQLREGLAALGFEIEREEAVWDGKKIYSVLSVLYTGEKRALSPLETQMGKIVPGSPHSARYAKSVEHNLTNKLRGFAHTGADTAELEALIGALTETYLKGGEDDDR